jgi:hypothetical protein
VTSSRAWRLNALMRCQISGQDRYTNLFYESKNRDESNAYAALCCWRTVLE